jgi:hypothetical protein
MTTRRGLFTPTNPQKYLGDIKKIRYLSSWEMQFMQNCDMNPNILAWGSEEFAVQYWNPVKNRIAKYFPDFIIKYKDAQGAIITEVLEIKPLKQSVVTKKTSTYDMVQLAINQAKWTAAVAVCNSHGIRFRILTELELFKQKPKKK